MHNSLSSLGEVWPGACVFPDFTQSRARSWWTDLVKDFSSSSVDGIWNDMNEPAVFKVRSETVFSTTRFFCFLVTFLFVTDCDKDDA